MKMTTKLFYKVYSGKPLLLRSCSPIASLSNSINFNIKRDAHTTIDPDDFFQKYPKMLKEFWEPEGLFKSIHALNYIRVPYVRDCLTDVAPGEKYSSCLKGKKILDVGCGGGLLSEGLAKLGAEVTGIDASQVLIEMAQNHASKNKRLANNKPSYILTTVEEHCLKHPDTYDAIVCSEVIEHVAQKEVFVESCARTTKPGGKLIFTTPTKTLFARFYLIFIFENVLRCYPKGAHHFEKFLRPSELKYMLEINDCFVESVKGYFYYPWGNYWDWTNNTQFSFATEAIKST